MVLSGPWIIEGGEVGAGSPEGDDFSLAFGEVRDCWLGGGRFWAFNSPTTR